MSKSFPSIQEELISLSEQKYQEALNTPGMKQNEWTAIVMLYGL